MPNFCLWLSTEIYLQWSKWLESPILIIPTYIKSILLKKRTPQTKRFQIFNYYYFYILLPILKYNMLISRKIMSHFWFCLFTTLQIVRIEATKAKTFQTSSWQRRGIGKFTTENWFPQARYPKSWKT